MPLYQGEKGLMLSPRKPRPVAASVSPSTRDAAKLEIKRSVSNINENKKEKLK